MKERWTTRCVLTLIPALLCVDRVSGQYAPVVNAGDISCSSSLQQQPGCSTEAYNGGDSMLETLSPEAFDPGYDGRGTGRGGGCGSGCKCPKCVGLRFPGGGGIMAWKGSRPKRCNKRFEIFGEYLHLRPRNAEVAYAVPIDGPVAPVLGGIQVGPTAIADPDHQGAYRVGFSFMGPGCSFIGAQWAHYENNTTNMVNINPPPVPPNTNLIRSMVVHPLTVNAATDGLNATAALGINFDTIDLFLRTPWKRCPRWRTDFLYGVRYGQLEQDFASTFGVNGTTTVTTQVDFNGVGPQIGLNSIRQLGCRGLHAYGRGLASFMVGKFDADYVQMDPFAGGQQVNSSWESGRIVPELELELGIGWTDCCGRFHLRCGYLVDAWFNAVRTNEYINSVQFNRPDGLGSGLTFDGLVARGEFRF